MSRNPLSHASFRRMMQTAGLIGGLLAALVGGRGTEAKNSVSFTILPGNLNVGLSAVDPEPAATDSTATGNVALTVDNATASDSGWSVVLAAGDLTCRCSDPSANLTIASLSQPVALAGERVDPTSGPFAVGSAVAADLSAPRTVVTADAGAGNGTYALEIELAVAAPGDGLPEGFSATLTVTVAAAP